MEFVHPYLPNSPEQKKSMISAIGLSSIEELFNDIPEKYRLKQKLDLPIHRSEYEVKRIVLDILNKNKSAPEMPTYLGGGVWPHYIPSIVSSLSNRSEFVTSYTPYQAEISQGMLQTLFEYQSLIAELLDMEVVNSSHYDWATSLGEAALMASRVTRRNRVLIPHIISPDRKSTLHTYSKPIGVKVDTIKTQLETGQIDLEHLKSELDKDTAALYIENPSYLGVLQAEPSALAELAHDNGSLFIVGVDPISLGIIASPGSYGADIVIGEGQPLGLPMAYGGPLLGIFACRDDMKLIRQMAGRLIGATKSLEGSEQGFVMSLQTREQHIRRERATSNICSNQAHCALTAAIYLTTLGPKGLQKLGETILYHSNYAIREINQIKGIDAPQFNAAHFKEFVVNYSGLKQSAASIHTELLNKGIHGGKTLKQEYPEFGESALYCVTELHQKQDIDLLVSTLKQVVEEAI